MLQGRGGGGPKGPDLTMENDVLMRSGCGTCLLAKSVPETDQWTGGMVSIDGQYVARFDCLHVRGQPCGTSADVIAITIEPFHNH